MAYTYIETPEVTKPTAQSLTVAQWLEHLDARIPALTDTVFTMVAFAALKLGVEYEAAYDNIIEVNGESFTAEVSGGQGAYNEDTGLFQNVTGDGVVIKSADKVYGNGSFIELTRKGSQQHKIHLYSGNTIAYTFDTDTGEFFSANNVLNLIGTAVFSGNYTAGDDVVVKVEITDDGVINIYEDDVLLLTTPIGWKVTAGTTSGAIDEVAQQPVSISNALDLAGVADEEGTLTVDMVDENDVTIGTGQVYTFVVGTVMSLLAGQSERTVADGDTETSVAIDLTSHASGGVGNRTYSIASGQIPNGVSIVNGILTGKPTQTGTFEFALRTKDEYGQTVTVNYTWLVTAPKNISYAPPNAVIGEYYDYRPPQPLASVTAWALAGTIPDGLVFNTANGRLYGTPTESGVDFNFTVSATFAVGGSDDVFATMTVYEELTVTEKDSEGTQTLLVENSSTNIKAGSTIQLLPAGGSGSYLFKATNDTQVDSNGNVRFSKVGTTVVTVTDLETNLSFLVTYVVEGQQSIQAIEVEYQTTEEDVIDAPTADIITQCGKETNIGFDGWSLISPLGQSVRRFPSFEKVVGGEFFNSGKPFAMFHAKAENAFAVISQTRGVEFITNIALTSSMINVTEDCGLGIGQTENLDTPLRYEAVLTNWFSGRVIELRKDGVYIENSRQENLIEGETLGFGITEDEVVLYRNDVKVFSEPVEENCLSYPLVVYSKDASNVFFGGQIGNLVYSIETIGTADEVGTINPTTGLYVPAANSLARITVNAESTVDASVNYTADIKVIKPSMRESFEQALLQFVPVQLWLADHKRLNDEPLDLAEDGAPDANQIVNAVHLGNLAGAVTIAGTDDRQEAGDDTGVITSSHRIQKMTLSGGYLQVRNPNTNQRVIPHLKVFVQNGKLIQRQYSSGCLKQQRAILIWENPLCEDNIKIFDAVEYFNAVSYTLPGMDVGLSAQSQMPLNIDCFKRQSDGAIYDYIQYAHNFTRI